MDRAARVRELLPELEEIRDASLAQAVVEIWVDFWTNSGWERLEDVPKNPKSLSNRDSITHVRSVTQQAIAAGRIVQELHKIDVDMDLLIAGSLLHDVSKIAEFGPKPGTEGEATTAGKLIQHGVLGASKVLERGLPIELAHLIVSHTAASNHPPKTIEGLILHYVDYLDSDVLLLDQGKPLLLNR